MLRLRWLLAIALLIAHSGASRHHKHRDVRQSHQPEDEDLQITVYPTEHTVREGRDASFECRARTSNNGVYPAVRWTRVGGPLPTGAYESGGRLTFSSVSLADAGKYVCIAQHNGRVTEAYATLAVNHYGPQELQAAGLPPSGQCSSNERACGTNECVRADYVCDGEPDCRDQTDEQNCPVQRPCEPNEFRCNNARCVQLMWKCDGDDDCGDGSDELNCGQRRPGDLCQPTEFKCADNKQCVPQSFQCDGTNDCLDGSDEIGCVQPTVVDPPDANKQVPQGDTFSLTCRAVAVPEAYINWRLNWGPVCDPPRCVQESEGGVGTLTVHNAQPVDQGAYTCEAINVKGRVLATPDCIVRIVSIPAPQPPPPPPRVPQTRCDPTGSVSVTPTASNQCQCKPLVTGPTCNECRPGSFHLNDRAPHGCLKCFCFGITDQCRSSDWFRTKEKLFFNGDSEGVTLSTSHGGEVDASFVYPHLGYLTHDEPHVETLYWTMPQRFKGDKVTAYGGKLSFDLQYSGTGQVVGEPLVILEGNGISLVHRQSKQPAVFLPDRPIHVSLETYEDNFERENGSPASREDLLMVLADLDTFKIRATHVPHQISTSLGDVSWEIAVDRDTQEGLALEVEQCSCPPGYVGLSCEDCAPGYERSGHGPYLGTCVPIRQTPPPLRTCPPGAVSPQSSYDGQCQCKPNLSGPNCDQCAASTFNYQPASPSGCLRCFCSGVTHQCRSSSYRRANVDIDYRRGDQDQLEISTTDVRNPLVPSTRPQVNYGQSINFANFEEARGQTLYWKLPAKFLGDKVTAYGGKLSFTFRFNGVGAINPDPVVLIRGNEITVQHNHRGQLSPDVDNTIEVSITEDQFERTDGQATTREHLIMALADLEDIFIKATYNDNCATSALISVSLEHAEPHGQGSLALEVEQCDCPPGYVGTSCEDCAPGYRRTGGGLYLGLCEPCNCNGHASQCDEEYGNCLNCQHNTEGDQCERCLPGFEGDARRGTPHDCRPVATKPPCDCNNHSPRGCDSYGRCLLCEHNTEGYHCESCKRGFYGEATKGTPNDCLPCPCPGATDCYIGNDGTVKCRNCPAGFTGDRCDKCAPGYTLSARSGGRSCEPIGRYTPDRIDFVGVPLQVEIHAPKQLSIKQGGRAKWTCVPVGKYKSDNVTIQWSRIGTNVFPPHVKQEGNTLVIDPVSPSDAGQYRCTGTTAKDIATDEAHLTVIPGTPPQIILTPPHQVVDINQQAAFTCEVPGVAGCEIRWHKEHIGGPLPNGVYRQGNRLIIRVAKPEHAGTYYCSVQTNFGIGQSNPGILEVKREPWSPEATPPSIDAEVGDSARFHCFVRALPTAQFAWRREDGQPLGDKVDASNGYLTILGAQAEHSGRYICTATDPADPNHPPVDASPVQLNVRQHTAPLVPQVDPLEQTVDLGQPAKFKCWVEGAPNAQLRWLARGNRPLPPGARDNNGELVFPSVTGSDTGEYVCSVFDPVTRNYVDSPPAKLDISNAPEPPQVDPPQQTVQSGTPATIRCWVPGNPAAQLSWARRGGHPLPPDAFDDGRGTLRIDSTQALHEGDYECSTRHPTDPRAPPLVSQPSRLNVQEPPRGPLTPVVDPPTQTVPENTPSTVNCHVPGHPDALLSFTRHGGQPLPAGAVDDGLGELRIDSTTAAHVGDYECHASDPTNPQAPAGVSSPARILVSQPSPGPEVDPPTQTVPEDSPSSIRCRVPGNEHARLSFTLRGGQPLPHGAVDDGRGTLRIDRTTPAHAVEYECHATDPTNPQAPPKVSPPARINLSQPSPGPEVDPPIQTVPENSPSSIRCWVPGKQDARLSFALRGGQPLPHGAVDDGRGGLRIDRTTSAHAVEYECHARDPANPHAPPKVSTPARIIVTPPTPGPEIDPAEQRVPEGSPSRIRCWVTGQPQARLAFTRRGGHPLPPGVVDDGQGNLHIAETQLSHAGEYECTATNPSRPEEGPRVSSPSKLDVDLPPPQIHVPDEGAPPQPVATPPVITAKRGEPARFHCDANSESPATIHWTFGSANTPLRGDAYQDGDDVVITAADDASAGEYFCTATNQYGSGIANPVRLVVVDNEEPPTARVEPKVINADVGDRKQFKCYTTGLPPPQVSWTGPDGESLPEGVVDLQDGVLDISNAQKAHEGTYTCNAVNVVGEASDTGVLNVGGDLSVRTDPVGPRILLTVGEPLEVKCEAIGDPDPDVEWLHDPGPERGDLPDDFKPVTISEQFIRHPSIGLLNAGKYTCKGWNAKQTATKTIEVVVVEPSHVATVSVLGGSNQWFPIGESNQLVCAATGQALIDKIEWARVDGTLPPDVEDHNEQGVLHFGTFKPSYAGQYECRGYRKNEVIGTSVVHVFPEDGKTARDVVRVEISPPKVRVVNEGDQIILDCNVRGNSGEVVYEWSLSRGGNLIRQLGDQSSLTVKKADPTNDYGVYKCNVENADGDNVGSAQTAVSVGFSTPEKAEHAKFEEESDAELVCPVYAVPGSVVTWTKDGDELPANAVPKGHKLSVTDFNEDSTGLYTCSVQIDQSTVEGYVNAMVYVPDTTIKLVLNVSSDNVAIGERVWLDCTAFGAPDAQIEFSKVGSDELPSTAQVTGNRLLFNSVTEEDAGRYVCRAHTIDGTLETNAEINVGSTKRKRNHQRRSQRRHQRRRVSDDDGTPVVRQRAGKKAHHRNAVFDDWFNSA